jgi:hypothetical protein
MAKIISTSSTKTISHFLTETENNPSSLTGTVWSRLRRCGAVHTIQYTYKISVGKYIHQVSVDEKRIPRCAEDWFRGPLFLVAIVRQKGAVSPLEGGCRWCSCCSRVYVVIAWRKLLRGVWVEYWSGARGKELREIRPMRIVKTWEHQLFRKIFWTLFALVLSYLYPLVTGLRVGLRKGLRTPSTVNPRRTPSTVKPRRLLFF